MKAIRALFWIYPDRIEEEYFNCEVVERDKTYKINIHMGETRIIPKGEMNIMNASYDAFASTVFCSGIFTLQEEEIKAKAISMAVSLIKREKQIMMVNLTKINALQQAYDPQPETNVIEVLKEVRDDLFYQLESKHGAKASKNYPCILKADAILKPQQ